MGKHVSVKTANVCELLPLVTGHLADNIALTMHHFIMGKRQHKVFAVVVPHAEGEVVLVKLAEPRIHAEIVEHVVHPAHVPFEVEPEAADVGGPGDHGPRGGFFRDRQHAREIAKQQIVHLTEEVCRFDVFASAILVGDPSAGIAVVVEVDHGRDGIDSDSINVVFVKPKQRVGDEIVADLVAIVVEHQRAPFFVFAFTRIFVFVEVRSVEEGKAMAIFREVSRHPIHDHADAVCMALIYKVHEILWGAEAGGAGVVADDLVAPGPVEGMFGDRENFDVGEAEIFDVGDELGGEFSVGEEAGTGFEV